jgi:hypothetical protein
MAEVIPENVSGFSLALAVAFVPMPLYWNSVCRAMECTAIFSVLVVVQVVKCKLGELFYFQIRRYEDIVLSCLVINCLCHCCNVPLSILIVDAVPKLIQQCQSLCFWSLSVCTMLSRAPGMFWFRDACLADILGEDKSSFMLLCIAMHPPMITYVCRGIRY